MIHTIFRNSTRTGIIATSLVATLSLVAALLFSIILQFTFPSFGQWIAEAMGQSRFSELIQILY